MADAIIVMYGGKIVEAGSTQDIFSDAYHPNTKRLIAAFLRTDINKDISASSVPLDFYDRECDCFVFSEFRKGESDPDWYEVA